MFRPRGARTVASEPGSGRTRGPQTRRRLRPPRLLRPLAAAGLGRLAAAARLARIEHLDLAERLADLGAGTLVEQVDHGAHGLDPDAGLLQIALVGLADPPCREVQDARDALQEEILHADLPQLLLEPALQLLLLGRRLLGRRRFALLLAHRAESSRPAGSGT